MVQATAYSEMFLFRISVVFLERTKPASSIAKPDTVLQLMMKAHKIACKMDASGTPIDYDLIGKKMARSKPALIDMLPSIVKYVDLWAGGSKHQFLDKLVAYSRTLLKPNFASLTVLMLGKINSVDMGVGLGGRYRCALMEGMIKYDKFVNSSHIAALGKPGNARTMSLKAEEAMEKFEHAVARLPQVRGKANEGIVIAQVAALDIAMVSYVHNLHSKKWKMHLVQNTISKANNSPIKKP